MPVAGSGFGFSIHNPSDGPISAVAFNNSADVTIESGVSYTPAPTTAVSLIVGKINWKPNGTPDEYFLFNVTDLSTEPAEATAIASITNLDFDQSDFNLVALCDGTNAVTDEIRFGTSFADVMGAIATSSAPSPADGAQYEATWANLSWRPGSFAVSHDMYFGTSFDDVNNGAEGVFVGNLATTSQVVGIFGFPVPEGLAPGTTYYWRVDERNDADPNSPWKGDVWSFWIPPMSAYEPSPFDGAEFVFADTELSWTMGMNAILNYVYFGDNFDDVNNATAGELATSTTFAPGTLELGKTYYWRVDESNPPNPTIKGDVWSFTTLPDMPIIDPNLVGWWKFEAGAGNTVIDFSGNGNHGTIVDKVVWVPGQFNLALEFLGDNRGHVELPPRMVTTASGSVALWVNTDQTGTGMFWYGTEGGGDGFGGENEIHIHSQGSGALGFAIEGATDVRLDGPMLAGTGWNHVAATWDQTDGCRLYFNGLQVDFQIYTGNVADLATIRLGRPASNFRFHDGFLDDVRLFDHALTAEQVNEIMTKGEDPLKAGAPSPGNGAVATIDVAETLTWSAGEGASRHDVYFGADRDALANATTDSPEYQGNQAQTSLSVAGMVEFGGGDYYWRVDEVAANGTVIAGAVWKFTVPDYLIVDDFESYNDLNEDEEGSNRIYLTWIDGYETANNGSQAGNLDPPFMSRGRSGGQAMPLSYDNAGRTSEATRTLVSNKDWTAQGVTKLVVWFSGDPANAADRMFVALGNAVVYHPDDAATQDDGWNEWVIDLQEFADQGADLTNIGSITLGFGTRNAPVAGGGTGTVEFDDIRLIR
jgi:hypothetical protein